MNYNKKGVILIIVLIVIVVISIMLPAYFHWTIGGQRNLLRRANIDYANFLAQAGLDKVQIDLHLDDDSWLDGEINNWTVDYGGSVPAVNTFYQVEYPQVAGFNHAPIEDPSVNPNCNDGYIAEVRYLFEGGDPQEGRIWVRSTGVVVDDISGGVAATKSLEQLVTVGAVRNIGQMAWSIVDDKRIYSALNPALADNVVPYQLMDDDNLAITDFTLLEDITINTGTLFIRGCYDSEFGFRNCQDHRTVINGDVMITGDADIEMSGLTIQ